MQLNPQNKKQLKLSLTPLIDVVFLLLIFFMLASTFTRFSSLPLSAKSSKGQVQETTKIILVRVNKDGDIEVNGEIVKKEELAGEIDQLAGDAAGETKLVIKPLEGASVQHLVYTIEHVKKSKLKDPIILR